MTLPRRTHTGAIVLALLMSLAGCATPRELDPSERVNEHSMDLEVRYTDDARRAVLYRVKPNGMFEFAGGRAALDGRATFTTLLAGQDVEMLRLLIEESGWETRELAGSGEPRQRRYVILLRTEKGGFRHDIRGECPDVEPVLERLETIANRRLKSDLDRQPDAGIQPD